MITPQYEYMYHYFSPKPVDFIIRFENLKEDLKNKATLYYMVDQQENRREIY